MAMNMKQYRYPSNKCPANLLGNHKFEKLGLAYLTDHEIAGIGPVKSLYLVNRCEYCKKCNKELLEFLQE